MSSTSESLHQAARQVLVGGVNSPVRAFNSVGGSPKYYVKGQGAWLEDCDGEKYVDYVGAWGPAIVGHAHPDVTAALTEQLQNGLSFGGPSETETMLAEMVVSRLKSAEKVRMVNSGTEAAMSALRLARAHTSRERIVKFEGCYHGHADSLLVKAGSGALTLGIPTSPGVPNGLAELTTTLRYNYIEGLESAFTDLGNDIAAVIVEPVAGNMSCVPPRAGFLERLRELCRDSGSVLIFDEVMTGFRVHSGCAEALYGVTPDLTILGKVIGGGMPVGAIAGPVSLMDQFAPNGSVYQAGTLSGNPLAMVCGIETLRLTTADGFYERLSEVTTHLCSELEKLANRHNVDFATNHVCGMFGMFFTASDSVNNFDSVMASDTDRFRKFFHLMLEGGVNLAPSAFESGFISSAHDEHAIDSTLNAANNAFAKLGAS